MERLQHHHGTYKSQDVPFNARPPENAYSANAKVGRGLRVIERCPECDNFSLSEIVLCKGTNFPAHKGRWYQVVSESIYLLSEYNPH